MKALSVFNLLFIVLAFIIVPFVLLEDASEVISRDILRDKRNSAIVALLGAGLLAADSILPVPSSIVATAMGALFGTAAGTAINVVGLTAGCALAYWIGRALRGFNRAKLHRGDYNAVAVLMHRYGDIALVLCRAVPVLAEASVILAGTFRLPVWRVIGMTALANLAVGGLYAAIGATAVQLPAVGAFALALLLPGLAFGIFVLFRRLPSGTEVGRPAQALTKSEASAEPKSSSIIEIEPCQKTSLRRGL